MSTKKIEAKIILKKGDDGYWMIFPCNVMINIKNTFSNNGINNIIYNNIIYNNIKKWVEEQFEDSEMQEAFNNAIDYAINTDSPKEFLRCWQEGDWESLRKEWPDFKLPFCAIK